MDGSKFEKINECQLVTPNYQTLCDCKRQSVKELKEI